MKKTEIIFPKPCNADWNEMSPQGCARFCQSCSTLVHDLAALSDSEVQSLLDKDEDVCARVQIEKDGTVVGSHRSRNERTGIVAVVSGSLSLAVAACQTVPPPMPLGDRHSISGEIVTESRGEVVAHSKEGWEFRSVTDSNGRFTFRDIPASTYSVSLAGDCIGMNSVADIVVTDQAVDLGQLDWDESGCFIIGVFNRRR